MNCSEKGLAMKADEADGEGGAGEEYLGAAGQVLLLRVGTEVEEVLLGVGDEAQAGIVGNNNGA